MPDLNCPSCELTTAGQHAWNCSNAPRPSARISIPTPSPPSLAAGEWSWRLPEPNPQAAELLDVLCDVVEQACSMDPKSADITAPDLDSRGYSAYARALRLLESLGRVKIVTQYGRRVIGQWKENENEVAR